MNVNVSPSQFVPKNSSATGDKNKTDHDGDESGGRTRGDDVMNNLEAHLNDRKKAAHADGDRQSDRRPGDPIEINAP